MSQTVAGKTSIFEHYLGGVAFLLKIFLPCEAFTGFSLYI